MAHTRFPASLRSRLLISHLLVSLVSITLISAFAAQSIIKAAEDDFSHNLEDLAAAAGNVLEYPLQEYRNEQVTAESIRDLLARLLDDHPELDYTVYRVDGTPLVSKEVQLPPRADMHNAPEVIEAMDSDFGKGQRIRNDGHGEQRLYVAARIQSELEILALIRLSSPTEPALMAARRSLALLLFTAVLVAFAVSWFGWWLANNLARPIQRLTQAAEQIASGDLDVRVTPQGPVELHRLAEAFNLMARRLKDHVTQLRDFVANASHELRTPLTVVKLRAEALRDGALEDPQIATRFVADIDNEVDRLVGMVNDLLDLSRMEAGLSPSQRGLFNLALIANEVFETFRIRAARSGVNLELDIEPGLPALLGNEDQIRRLFYNLVDNAIKYTPADGKVEILLRSGQENKTVRILVRDTGPGIPEDHLPHVFERFYRGETTRPRVEQVRGSGLGLAIAKSIVELHGGVIGVNSQVGRGSTFWAELPAVT